ncbi:hypothetical protein C9374_009809 [Naegleria lovaniensis]|uniref:Calponin-homology (CH) domain-containing protein n=1 Tax=Naegleria lovaniensis TaxID=51637 RepID=A0AA88KRH0_NAELO|nr:uncharacterized protein C9374_009809 [Naegleria lovaniensis]KAG2393232.1 hypothetical protein C9374_009809 [Naegleria lovaniensis]
MNPLDPNWVEVQHRSFLNWVNSKLKNRNIQLTNLAEDFKTGENLLLLLSELTKTEYPLASLRPQYRIQMMNNIAEALNIITKDLGIQLVNIDSNDIVDGNLKLILAVVYALIYKFQICQVLDQADLAGKENLTKQNPEALLYIEQLLLQWLNSTLYNNQPVLTNLTTDWTDGENLKKLILHLTNGQSSTLNDPEWSSFDPVKKLSLCIDQAENELHIPRIQDAQDLAQSPDRFSMIAYLSYFRMVKKKNEEQQIVPPTVQIPPVQMVQEPKKVEEHVVVQPPVDMDRELSASSAPPLEEVSNVNPISQPPTSAVVHVQPPKLPQQMPQYQHHQPKPQQPILVNQPPPSSQPEAGMMNLPSSHLSQQVYLPQQKSMYPNIQISSPQSPVTAQLQQQWLPSSTTSISTSGSYPNNMSHPSSAYLPNSTTSQNAFSSTSTSQQPQQQPTIYPMNMTMNTMQYQQQQQQIMPMMGIPQPNMMGIPPQNSPQIVTTTTTTTHNVFHTDMFGNVYSPQLPPQGPYFY